MKFPFRNDQTDEGNKSPPLTDMSGASVDQEKRRSSSLDESRVPWVTWRSLVLGAFVSIGGIIFGYDTGQISGFLEMRKYKQRYGQLKNGTYTFSNVRSGLIVSLVSANLFCDNEMPTTIMKLAQYLILSAAFHWHTARCTHGGSLGRPHWP